MKHQPQDLWVNIYREKAAHVLPAVVKEQQKQEVELNVCFQIIYFKNKISGNCNLKQYYPIKYCNISQNRFFPTPLEQIGSEDPDGIPKGFLLIQI